MTRGAEVLCAFHGVRLGSRGCELRSVLRMRRVARSAVLGLAVAAAGCAFPPALDESRAVATIDGARFDPVAVAPGAVRVFVFVSTECPIANSYAPRLCELAQGWNGRDVEFVGVQVAELHLGLGGADLPDRSRQVLEASLRQVVQGVVDRALNDGLPSLPLPEFVIPDSLGVYDLPAGAGLGLRDARLFSTEAWWMLDGRFGQ